MRNPFSFGVAVTGDSFCNRVQELYDLKKAVESSRKLFIFGERRLGKTSLLKKLISSLDKDDFIPVYIDIWKCISEKDFITACANAYAKAYETKKEKIFNFAKEFFGSISPSITVDSEGNPTISFGAIPASLQNTVLEEVLSIPEKIAEIYPQKQLVIIFDEFPQIRSFESDRAERVLRSVIQHHEDISYIFCGSRKHMIREMFMDKSSPLYRSAAHYPVSYISLDHWIPFIMEKFKSVGKTISSDCVEYLFSITDGHPFYTQMLSSVCFEIADTDMTAVSTVDEAFEILMRRESHAFLSEWENFSVNEKKLILSIAKEKYTSAIYSTEFIKKHQLPSASTIQRTVKKLLENDVLDKDSDGRYYISDKFFSRWILRKDH